MNLEKEEIEEREAGAEVRGLGEAEGGTGSDAEIRPDLWETVFAPIAERLFCTSGGYPVFRQNALIVVHQ